MRITSMLALSLLAGCPDRSVSAIVPEQVKVETKLVPATPNRDVDLLFLIDNSGSMAEEQSSLRANFGKFMDVLSTIEGGIPNLHIGVATSNLGQSASDGVGGGSFGAGCAGSGDDGGLRTAAGISGRFIIDEEASGGVRNRNYSGTLGDAFSALADVGTSGCGIEQHLGSMKRALENPLNTGFLRPNAKLAVIFIADEDDCSLAHKALFEGSGDGTVVNFRCTQEGIECDDGGDLSTPGLRQNCMPKADSLYLSDVDRYVDFLRSLKTFPDEDIMVGGIVGDPEPVEISTDSMGRAVLEPSCTYSGQNAFPAVRTADFVSQFAVHERETICNGDLSVALTKLAATLVRTLEDTCFANSPTDLDPAPGVQADCSVSDMRRRPDGTYEEVAVVPSCDAAPGALPCWRVQLDPDKCFYTESQLAFVVDRGGEVPASDLYVKAHCVTAEGTGPVL